VFGVLYDIVLSCGY